MKTLKEFREEASTCSACGCDPESPKDGCDCTYEQEP